MKQSARQLLTAVSFLMAAAGAAAAADIPQIVRQDGRFALMVDGAPFVILGGQAQNSSNYPLALNKVFAAIKDMHANTLEIPVAWEQIEREEGKFDFSYVDTLVAEARKNNVKLVLLWFGTWKNTGPNYAPEWVKFNNTRFPRMVAKDAVGRRQAIPADIGVSVLEATRAPTNVSARTYAKD